jgi:hypothetical protein
MSYSESTNKKICTHLGAQALSAAPKTLHAKYPHAPPVAPPASPNLPHGSLWSLMNHVKVLHQYTTLLSEAASGQGVHSPLLCGHAEMCQTHPALAWFAPLLAPVSGGSDNEYQKQYQKHVDIWRQANPGLYCHAEAAYHVHQGYAVEDRNMTRFLVSKLMEAAKEYEVDVAGNILRARPASFGEFQDQFTNWRRAGLYHGLCLAARNMPKAEQWVPKAHLHEAGDWQDLLDEFNEYSFCTKHRMADFCERLMDRSPALSNHVCSMLDRVAILMRVKSNPSHPTPLSASTCLDDYLPMLQLPIDESSPYTHCLATWGRLRQVLEEAVPPSLLCPSLYPPSNRGAWGYSRLDLGMKQNRLCIVPGPFQWMDKDAFPQKDASQRDSSQRDPTQRDPTEKLPDRLYDILMRMGEAATSPEVAHLMLSPATMADCLAGKRVDVGKLRYLADRNYVIRAMQRERKPDPAQFTESVNRLVSCLPVVGVRQFPSPKQFLAWRVDLPPRVLLYQGRDHEVDLRSTPPYRLPKLSLQDRLPNRTVSGISVLAEPTDDAGALHTALRACVAEEILGPHADFADHPHHKVALKVSLKVGGPGETEVHHTTTLAEAVSLFTGPPPFSISDVALHESEPWGEDHIDDRYAERQKADNGLRFRDWATVYHDGQEMQRCRMASHAVTCGEVYETHFPLATPAGYKWVSVASTLPAETRVLRHLGGNAGLEVLKRSVENRYMHDPKLLPVASKADRVDKEHMEIYTDRVAGQVLLAYAPVSPDGQRRAIEFMSFRHYDENES